MEVIKELLSQAVQAATGESAEIVLSIPDEQFGDYATNAAMQLSKKLGQNPREIAGQIVAELEESASDVIAEASIAGPGFINLRLTDATLLKEAGREPKRTYDNQVVVAEYSDPNPFKVLHAGHLYTSVVGDAIANLLAVAGGTVHRVNFGGDVGLHVGKTMWAILQRLGGENPDELIKQVGEDGNPEWLAEAYVEGTNAYEDDTKAKTEIIKLNKQVYKVHQENDHESPFAQIYWLCRDWSYKYFDTFYELIGSKFEKYYPESEVADLGLETVKAHIQKGIFEESEGAVVFKGEPYGLHTRVFINSEGIPTYEAKDVGLIMQKKKDYNFDKSVVITGNEQQQYMTVVLKAVEQFEPELVEATTHLTHGLVKLQGGVKMSSRKGNILRAVDVLHAADQANEKASGKKDTQVSLAAVKYAFLKQRLGGDIIYNPEESVSLQGNSGPYLQYAHVRARSIVAKSTAQAVEPQNLEPQERTLVRKLSEYASVIELATQEMLPHHICTYLYELSQVFNRFYENNRVIGDPREAERLNLVHRYADTLKAGLLVLNIPAPDKM
jgi:arginyl-tRNA synthetase